MDKLTVQRTIDRLLLGQPSIGDRLVIPESRLAAVVRGEAKFTLEEAERLLNCAATLHRYRRLKQIHYANVPLWEGQGQLLAAGDGSVLLHIDLRCPVGEATLYFLYEPEGVALSLELDTALGRFCAAEQVQLEVWDGAGHLLLAGRPDEDDRVEGIWPHNTAPKEWLLAMGKPLRLLARRLP